MAAGGELLTVAVCVSTSRLYDCRSVIEAWQRSINHYTAALIDIVRGKNYIEGPLKICHNVHPA